MGRAPAIMAPKFVKSHLGHVRYDFATSSFGCTSSLVSDFANRGNFSDTSFHVTIFFLDSWRNTNADGFGVTIAWCHILYRNTFGLQRNQSLHS